MNFLYWICWVIAYLPLRICYPIRVVNKKNLNKKHAILACNHTTNLDIVLLKSHQHIKSYVLAKHQLFNGKFVSKFLRMLGAIPVNREEVGLSTIKETLKVLKEDKQLVIFPEGTRKISINETESLKAGMIMFALKSKSPIIPVVFINKPKIFRFNKILVGEPIDLSEYYDQKQSKELMQELSDVVLQAMQKLRNDYYEAKRLKKQGKKDNQKFIS